MFFYVLQLRPVLRLDNIGGTSLNGPKLKYNRFAFEGLKTILYVTFCKFFTDDNHLFYIKKKHLSFYKRL